MTRFRPVPSLLALIASGGVTAAEPVVGSGTVTVTGEDALPYEVESTATALFDETPLVSTPFSVGSYNRALIEDQRAFTTAEVLRNDPSVFTDYGGGAYGYYDGFGIRGFSSHNNQNYRVDGLSFSNQGEVPIDNKERIDVLKGPAGLRFGFMPPGGAINFVRKRPTDAATGTLHFDADSHGQLYTQADIGGHIDEGAVGYRIVAAGQKLDSFWDNADGQRVFTSALIDWRINEVATVWGSVERNDRDATIGSGALISQSGIIFDRGPEVNYNSDWSTYDVRQENLQVGAEVSITEDWSLFTTSAVNDFNRDNSQTYVDEVRDDGTYDVYEYTSNDEGRPHWSNQTHISGTFETGSVTHALTIGGSYRRHEMTYGDGVYTLLGTSDIDNPVYYNRSGDPVPPSYLAYEAQEYAAFLTDSVTFSEEWSALGGLRFGRFSSVNRNSVGAATQRYAESALSPTAAMQFRPAEGWHTYLLYTQGLQPGGIAPTGTTNQGEAQDPLASRQVELGAKAELPDQQVSGEAALFWIEQDLEYTNSSNTYVQDGNQVHLGLELALRGQLTDALQAGMAATWLDAEQEETGDAAVNGSRPLGVAELQGNLWLSWDTPWVDGLALLLNAYWVGERYADNTEDVAIDSYLRLDAGARYRLDADAVRWTFRLNLENITDEEYIANAYHFAGWGGRAYYGSPFAARLSAQADF